MIDSTTSSAGSAAPVIGTATGFPELASAKKISTVRREVGEGPDVRGRDSVEHQADAVEQQLHA